MSGSAWNVQCFTLEVEDDSVQFCGGDRSVGGGAGDI